MDRLRFQNKLVLIGAASALAMGVLTAILVPLLQQNINSARRELRGVAVIEPLTSVVKAMQNAALVEEASAAMRLQKEQMQGLVHAVAVFRLADAAVAARPWLAAVRHANCLPSEGPDPLHGDAPSG